MAKQFGNYLEKFSLSDGQLAFKDWTGAWLVVHFQGGTAYRYDGKPLSERNWAREESKKGSAEARTLPMFPNGNDLQSKKRKVFGECDINDDSVDSLENVESGETWEPGSQPSEPSGRPTEAASAGSTPVSPSTRSRSTRTRQTAPTESSSQSPRTSPNSLVEFRDNHGSRAP